MAVQMILNQKGPLPITAQFNSIGDSPMWLEVNGSVWTGTPNTMIGIAIAIDGQSVGTAYIFSNGSTTHRACVPAYIQVQLSQGPHKLTLSNAANTTSDSNDFFTAVIHY
ncbi:MAG TPA: hypothetical protein VLB87_02910 [Pyrinomonadaceae bacterium]|nr:hypothetical protein [Pyrinomonadaceae bacterium]